MVEYRVRKVLRGKTGFLKVKIEKIKHERCFSIKKHDVRISGEA